PGPRREDRGGRAGARHRSGGARRARALGRPAAHPAGRRRTRGSRGAGARLVGPAVAAGARAGCRPSRRPGPLAGGGRARRGGRRIRSRAARPRPTPPGPCAGRALPARGSGSGGPSRYALRAGARPGAGSGGGPAAGCRIDRAAVGAVARSRGRVRQGGRARAVRRSARGGALRGGGDSGIGNAGAHRRGRAGVRGRRPRGVPGVARAPHHCAGPAHLRAACPRPRGSRAGRRIGFARADGPRAPPGSRRRHRFARGAVRRKHRTRARNRRRRPADAQRCLRRRGANRSSVAGSGPATGPGELARAALLARHPGRRRRLARLVPRAGGVRRRSFAMTVVPLLATALVAQAVPPDFKGDDPRSTGSAQAAPAAAAPKTPGQPPPDVPEGSDIQSRKRPEAPGAATEKYLAPSGAAIDANDILDEMLDPLAADVARLGPLRIGPILLERVRLSDNLNPDFAPVLEARLAASVARTTEVALLRCAECWATRGRLENGAWVVSRGVNRKEEIAAVAGQYSARTLPGVALTR